MSTEKQETSDCMSKATRFALASRCLTESDGMLPGESIESRGDGDGDDLAHSRDDDECDAQAPHLAAVQQSEVGAKTAHAEEHRN